MVPLYQQLSEKIKQQIADGKLKAGDKLMTEAEFSQHFEVSRITVRKAIELLADDGFVVRKQGIGTFCGRKEAAPCCRQPDHKLYGNEQNGRACAICRTDHCRMDNP